MDPKLASMALFLFSKLLRCKIHKKKKNLGVFLREIKNNMDIDADANLTSTSFCKIIQ